MKNFFLLAALMISTWALAGDIIVTRDAKKIDAKILEVSKSEIKYKEIDNLDGPTFILEISEISSVIYSNGKVQVYNNPQATIETNKNTIATENTIAEQAATIEEAQSIPDIIHTLSGEELSVKVQDVKQGVLFYKNWNNLTGETFTMNTSNILNVQYSNGIIQVYNSNVNPTKSVVVNNNVDKSNKSDKVHYITRSGNKYIYDGRTMQGRVFNNSSYSKLLETKCEPAYEKFQTGVIVAACGWGFFIGGVTVDIAFSWWAPYTGYGALVAEVASIPLLITGYCQMHKSAEIFNMQCANNTTYSWSINSSKDGIGLAFNF